MRRPFAILPAIVAFVMLNYRGDSGLGIISLFYVILSIVAAFRILIAPSRAYAFMAAWTSLSAKFIFFRLVISFFLGESFLWEVSLLALTMPVWFIFHCLSSELDNKDDSETKSEDIARERRFFNKRNYKKLDVNLFDRKLSDTKKIDLFLAGFDNSRFLRDNDCLDVLNAETRMLDTIHEGRQVPRNASEVERVIVSILKANYSSLLQLQDIYKLEGAGERLNDKVFSVNKNKVLGIYRTISIDIKNFIKLAEREGQLAEEEERIRAQKEAIEKKEDAERLLDNSLDLL